MTTAGVPRWVQDERAADGHDGRSPLYPPGPHGLLYRCWQCEREFSSPSGARKHEHLSTHTVLRSDWLHPSYLELLKQAARAQERGQ